MGALANREFVKMNGLGNEIVIVDLRSAPSAITGAEACAAARYEPYDQLMALYPTRGGDTDALIRIYNSDGSEAGACGNGMRCVAALVSAETGKQKLQFETPAGLIACWGEDRGLFTVDMGRPCLRWDEIPLAREMPDTKAIDLEVPGVAVLHSPSVVNVGNPHAIFWVADVAAYDLGRAGPLLEHHPIFPEGANISLAQVTAADAITVRTWERGAGLTRACGSAACAACVCAARKGLAGRRVWVTLPGGRLLVAWHANDHILMTGPVVLERAGVLDLPAD